MCRLCFRTPVTVRTVATHGNGLIAPVAMPFEGLDENSAMEAALRPREEHVDIIADCLRTARSDHGQMRDAAAILATHGDRLRMAEDAATDYLTLFFELKEQRRLIGRF